MDKCKTEQIEFGKASIFGDYDCTINVKDTR